MNVYFISGMSANCKVFDAIKLPEGFNKKYIEWLIPYEKETLDEYTHRMSSDIDVSEPFVLIGYSFGGIIVQEMNKYLTPQKTIIIASMKTDDTIPALFRWGRKIGFPEHLPTRFFKANDTVFDFIARFVYRASPEDMAKYVSYTDAVYTKWCLNQILHWDSSFVCPNLYHIHGTRDQMFPFKLIRDVYPVDGGDHLLVLKKSREMNSILAEILYK